MPDIRTSVEGKRGCGYRKPGGLYIVAGEAWRECDKLPIVLTVCPTCHAGIKPSRGWTWINPRPLVPETKCSTPGCVLSPPPEKAGLLWIGESFYSRPIDWLREANTMGVSRRIAAVPRGFKVGETLVLVAHRKGRIRPGHAPEFPDVDVQGVYDPTIFAAFVPQRIEYVVKAGDSLKKLEALEKRGISLVRVVREGEPIALDLEESHATA